MTYCIAYITAGSAEEARTIARALVEARLAACANILGPITSFYWWDGAVQEEGETVLIAKTREDLFEPLVERVGELHSYDCPCVVRLPITGGNPDFLKWLGDETKA